MATEAAPRRSKRLRKPSPTIGHQPGDMGSISISRSPATGAPDPKPSGAGSRRQDPGAGGVDHTMALPDAVIEDIISLLPTKDAGRARAVSPRWRVLWRTAPLNLDCLELFCPDTAAATDAAATAISGIISAHHGPGRRFRVDTRFFHTHPETADAWLRSPALDNLQELDMCDYQICQVTTARPPLPPSALRFSPCLRVATLSYCSISDGVAQGVRFPQMKKLALERVSISDGALQRLISNGCPILECLLLGLNSCCARIKSASLRSIGVLSQVWYNESPVPGIVELIVEEAPCLEKLLFLEEHLGLRVKVIEGAAPKLETLGGLYDTDGYFRFVFGRSMVIERGLNVIGSRTVMRSVKVLAVSIFNLSLDRVIDLMMCFPCLEKLYVESCRYVDKNLWRRKHRHLLRSFEIRLKTLVFLNYRGIKSQANFAKFFILNAKLLETMRFVGRSCYMDNKDFIYRQYASLEVEKRASIGAKFYFTTDKCGDHLTHARHVHDLSITDPFECSC
ncbi:unnamed protein product [Urochloa decumbens]|uniref:F-box domain-containing protein n=1 Tax=Urochloa decumbens TaxID=240449 RepID=A0ABC9FL53_9POAL